MHARAPEERPEQCLSIALCCRQMSPVVEVCGCRPHDGGAARTGAAVRNPNGNRGKGYVGRAA